jgi:lysozyme
MSDFKFTNAAKFFIGEPHQIDAFEYLQEHTSPEVAEEFKKRFRNENKIQKKLPYPGVALIKEFEGFSSKAYYDPASGGLPITIGFGSTRRRDGSRFMIGNTITQQEADELLIYQLETEYLPPLEKIPYWNEMNDEMKSGLLSFSYNLGSNFYGSSGFNTITRVLKEKDWKAIPKTLELYRNPGTSVEAGLLRRRRAEGKLFQQGLDKLNK